MGKTEFRDERGSPIVSDASRNLGAADSRKEAELWLVDQRSIGLKPVGNGSSPRAPSIRLKPASAPWPLVPIDVQWGTFKPRLFLIDK
jgi:hypothetical protein